eukprot:scaffold29788_cov38-Phaeocystis_antarctica.AAC.1
MPRPKQLLEPHTSNRQTPKKQGVRNGARDARWRLHTSDCCIHARRCIVVLPLARFRHHPHRVAAASRAARHHEHARPALRQCPSARLRPCHNPHRTTRRAARATMSMFGRVGGRLLGAYEGALLRRPIATKCAMSVAVLGTADACAQRLQHYNNPPPLLPPPSDGGGRVSGAVALAELAGASEVVAEVARSAAPGFELDLRRQSAVAIYAFCFQGPFGHFWYNPNPNPDPNPNPYPNPTHSAFKDLAATSGTASTASTSASASSSSTSATTSTSTPPIH